MDRNRCLPEGVLLLLEAIPRDPVGPCRVRNLILDAPLSIPHQGLPLREIKGRGSSHANDPAIVQQLVDLLQTLGVSQQVVQDVQQAVNKSKPRVVDGKKHALYVLKQKLDKANNHLAHVDEVLQKKEAEYLSALNRVEKQKALVTQLVKDYWEARKRLESLFDGEDETERQAVSLDEKDNDMSQHENLLDNQYPEGWETVQPKK